MRGNSCTGDEQKLWAKETQRSKMITCTMNGWTWNACYNVKGLLCLTGAQSLHLHEMPSQMKTAACK